MPRQSQINKQIRYCWLYYGFIWYWLWYWWYMDWLVWIDKFIWKTVPGIACYLRINDCSLLYCSVIQELSRGFIIIVENALPGMKIFLFTVTLDIPDCTNTSKSTYKNKIYSRNYVTTVAIVAAYQLYIKYGALIMAWLLLPTLKGLTLWYKVFKMTVTQRIYTQRFLKRSNLWYT